MKNLRIAHIIIDNKFSDSAYELFETVAPSCNKFFLPSHKVELQYIKKTPVTFIKKYSFLKPSFLKSLASFDFVVLHSLTAFNQRLVLLSDTAKITFVWIGMGYDYYDLISGSNVNFFYITPEILLILTLQGYQSNL